jgi:hypothetical protein
MGLKRIKAHSGLIVLLMFIVATVWWLRRNEVAPEEASAELVVVAAEARYGDLDWMFRVTGVTSALNYATVSAPRGPTSLARGRIVNRYGYF